MDCDNRSSEQDVEAHLRRCEATFIPPLGQRVKLGAYAAKLVARAFRIESWCDDSLIALVGMYCGDDAFISNVSVESAWIGKGIGSRLLLRAIAIARGRALPRVRLEVAADNQLAIRLYARHGFCTLTETDGVLMMELILNNGASRDRTT